MSSQRDSGIKIGTKIIDSHLHIWDGTKQAFAEGQTPPDTLEVGVASVEELMKRMEEANVSGCLIVQPINYKYDHSYVGDVISEHPDKFKGMLLYDPVCDKEESLKNLEELLLQGFVSVRFNPYLFEGKMSDEGSAGLDIYKKCGELNMPVGIMCFQGLGLHYDDIVNLLEKSPNTPLILDHFGFTRMDTVFKTETSEDFNLLLKLAKYPNVYVKISALFRIGALWKEDWAEELMKTRFDPLIEAYGASRLMIGSDFPFVELEDIGYRGTFDIVSSWCDEHENGAMIKSWILGGTAEKVFGPWGTTVMK